MIVATKINGASDQELRELALRLSLLLQQGEEMPEYHRMLDQVEETRMERMLENNPYKEPSK